MEPVPEALASFKKAAKSPAASCTSVPWGVGFLDILPCFLGLKICILYTHLRKSIPKWLAGVVLKKQ